jgi:glucosamine-6-phosphate deaminase
VEVVITSDYSDLSRRAARIIAAQIRLKPDSVLGLATGSTPLGIYRELVRFHTEEGLDFSRVGTFNLDEYLGISPQHPQSYNHFMWENLFKHLNISPRNVHIPEGTADDPEAHCCWYETEIARMGGIDLQLLGIGRDGHIAFNEPGSSLASRTRLKTLDRDTIADNARFFSGEEEVPRFAITMGVGTILESRRILLVASGESKAACCAEFIEGPVSAMVTASALQFHEDVVVILDEAAASRLKRREYYNWVRDHKNRVQKYPGG